jgi:tellurite resistance protein TehA-like permease
MGTGVVGILLDFIPFHARWLYYLSILFFALNALIFLASFVASALRYAIWPEIWAVMIQDPNNSLFLGTFPMGLATLIQLWTAICVPVWGEWALTFAWVWWMIDTIIAVATAVSLPILLYACS